MNRCYKTFHLRHFMVGQNKIERLPLAVFLRTDPTRVEPLMAPPLYVGLLVIPANRRLAYQEFYFIGTMSHHFSQALAFINIFSFKKSALKTFFV